VAKDAARTAAACNAAANAGKMLKMGLLLIIRYPPRKAAPAPNTVRTASTIPFNLFYKIVNVALKIKLQIETTHFGFGIYLFPKKLHIRLNLEESGAGNGIPSGPRKHYFVAIR
jgi:hypothetical protein